MEESKEQNDVSSCSDDDFQSCVSNEEGRLSLLREQEFFGVENEERQGLLAPPRRRISISSSASRRRTRQTATTSNMRHSLPTRISITALFLEGSSSSSIVEQILFFGCGLGSSVSYIATLSALVYFKMMYGPNSFVALNVATYLPLLPVSLAQARWDQYMDQQYQSRRTFLARGVVGFGMVLWGTIGLALSNTPKTTSTHGGTIHMNDASLSSAIRYTLWQGMGSAILYGTLNQMASFVTTTTASTIATPTETETETNSGAGGGNSLKATVSAGVQASALLVLFLNLVTGFNGDTYVGRTKFPLFLWTVVAVEAVCFVMFLLKLRRPLVAASMLRRDYSIRSDDDDDDGNDNNDDDTSEPDPFFDEELDYEVPLLGIDDLSSSSKSNSNAGNNSIHGYNDGGDSSIRSGGGDNVDYNSLPLRRRLFDCSSDSSEQRSRQLDDRGHRRGGGPNQQRRRTNNMELPYYQLWQQTKDCCLVLAGTLIPSFLVGSWFTRVETDWTGLAQILFYVRIASDFLGRLATIVMPPQSVSCLTWTMILRYIPVVAFFLNSKQEPAQEFLGKIGLGAWTNGNDVSSIFLVAIIAFQSGYLVTGCFQLAPLALPIELREANQSKQASLLTVAFSVSALLGLASSFTLIAIGV